MLALPLLPEDAEVRALFSDGVELCEVESVLLIETGVDEVEDVEDAEDVEVLDGEANKEVAVVVMGYGSPASR